MIRRIALVLIGLSLVIGTAAACDDSDDSSYYSTVCINPATQFRVDYVQCNTHPGWVYYLQSGQQAARIGSKVKSYNKSHYKKPSSATIKTNGAPTKGGSVPKVTSGPGVKVYKPKNNAPKVNNKPGGGYKAPAPRPAPKVGK